jgi:hypothetical protein
VSDSAPAPNLLMSLRDIAELAAVQRPVVSNWRRRHKSFPKQAGGDRSRPLFDPQQVADWLISTERKTRPEIHGGLSLFTIASMGEALTPTDLIAYVTALICLRYLDDEPLAQDHGNIVRALQARADESDPNDELILAEVLKLPTDGAWLAIAVDKLIEAAGCKGAFERVMNARHRLRASMIAVNVVAPELAGLVAKLSGAVELAVSQWPGPILVSDPSAGSGDLLVAVLDALGADHLPACQAAERDPYLARLIRRRLMVHGADLNSTSVHASIGLPAGSGAPDVIVTQVPYVPAEDRSAEKILIAIDDISLWLRTSKSAVILGPADVLAGELPRYSSAERDRWRLVESGLVEAIIRLPGGLIPFRPGYETALWVLNSEPDAPWREAILLADVSGRELTNKVADELAEDILTWRRPGYTPTAHHRIHCVQAHRSDLEKHANPFSIRPPRNIRTEHAEAEDRVNRVLTLESELNRIAADAIASRPAVPRTVIADVHDQPDSKSIGQLINEGFLAVGKGTRIDAEHIDADGQHAVFGPQEVLGIWPSGQRRIDRAILADKYPRAKLSEPGDVLVSVNPAFGVTIDIDGFSVIQSPVRALRVTEDGRGILTPRVLAALLGEDRGNHRPSSAIRDRRLEDHQIAMLPPAVVADLDLLLSDLAARRTRAADEIDILDELAKLATAGLSDGTLSLAGDNK